MKLFHILLILLLSAATAFGVARYVAPQTGAGPAAAKENAYERVIRTGTIRCGYVVAAPYLTKDPATGKLGGIWHDFTEAVAAHLGVKVDWAEELGYGDIGTSLDANRIDIFCGGLWTAGKRVRSIDFLDASAFEPMLAFVRIDDHRFDNDLSLINSPDVSVSTIDGEGGGLVAAEDFPKAKFVSLPQMANYADMFNQVITHKADVLFAAPSGAAVVLKNNPGTLRPIANRPLRIYPVALAVKYGENELRDMLNQAQKDIIYNGAMDKIISKYEVNKGDFWHVAVPYMIPGVNP